MSILTTEKKRSIWQRFCDFFTTNEDGLVVVETPQVEPILDHTIQEAAALAAAESYVIQYDEKNIIELDEVKKEPAIQEVEETTVETTVLEPLVETTVEDNQ
jgi:hypothetical protein